MMQSPAARAASRFRFRRSRQSAKVFLRPLVLNAAKATGGVLMKKVLYFQPCALDEDPSAIADRLVHEKLTEKNAPRFILNLGKRAEATEWCVVPLEHIKAAIPRIVDRSIVNYRYDPLSQKIVPR